MITISQLHKSFGKNHVLRGLDLRFEGGGVPAILGPNGSGKTTLIKSLLGMVIPDRGQIHIGGQNVRGAWRYREQISYLPQIARFPENLRVQELLDMVQDLRGQKGQPGPLIERLGLGSVLPARLGQLSGGTRQKVNLVQAFMYDSPLLILDEPTAGLDPVSLLHLKELIRAEQARGKLILVITHIMRLVEEIADDIVFLLEGNIHFRGSQAQLAAQYGSPDIETAIARLLQAAGPASPPPPPATPPPRLSFQALRQGI